MNGVVDEKAKVSVQVNDATIQAVLKLCNFEAIIGDVNDDADEEQGDEQQAA